MRNRAAILLSMLAMPAAFADTGIIGGQVQNPEGDPEAGVWVIAETTELPTTYRKIVVTDDDGRFVLPELPDAGYEVWVRGYGIADSAKTRAKPGRALEIEVEPADSDHEAASVYPANYWLGMMEPPPTEALKRADNRFQRGPVEENFNEYPSQEAWLSQFKLNCIVCHQPGSAPIRAIMPSRAGVDYGLRKAGLMDQLAEQLNRDVLLDQLEQWGKKLAAGETPQQAPPRPEGIERNFVITEWEYGEKYTYSHDVISTDKRNPTLYPNGRIYGLDIGNDHLMILDPDTHEWEQIKLEAGWEGARPWCEQTYKPLEGEPVPVGAQMLGCPAEGAYTPHKDAYRNAVNPHNPMLDDTGKLWITMQIRREWAEDMPEFCLKDPVIADNYHDRQLAYYDTETGEIVKIDTCFGTHHLQFDPDDRLWINGDSYVVGWFDPEKFDPDKPETLEDAQGWSEVKVDTDGDGTADTPIIGFRYSIIPNPADGDVWIAIPPGSYGKHPSYGERGWITRYDPETDTHEAYRPPFPAHGARGIDVDTEGNVWAAMAGSGHLARFDRSKCKQTWGDGDQCPEGWTVWQTPGPRFEGAEDIGTGFHYYTWVDQFDTLGMGRDTVIVNGTNSDSLIAFRPDTEEFTVIRVPYPMRTFTRGVDGRIDDEDGGWKGRGLWFTNGIDPVFTSEVPRTYVGHVQLRPDPLAH